MGCGAGVHQRVIDAFDEAQAFEQLGFVMRGAEAQSVLTSLVSFIGIARRQQPAELRFGGRGNAQNGHHGEKQLFHNNPCFGAVLGGRRSGAVIPDRGKKGTYRWAKGYPAD